jgi:hypothetical protein
MKRILLSSLLFLAACGASQKLQPRHVSDLKPASNPEPCKNVQVQKPDEVCLAANGCLYYFKCDERTGLPINPARNRFKFKPKVNEEKGQQP